MLIISGKKKVRGRMGIEEIRKFWERIRECEFIYKLRSLPINCYRAGDMIQDEKSYLLEELEYVTSEEDSNYGAVLFRAGGGNLPGSVVTVSGERFMEVIEGMRSLISGEVLLEELLTDNEDWKREIFLYIYGR